jgi:hypothetical protein
MKRSVIRDRASARRVQQAQRIAPDGFHIRRITAIA